MFDKIYYGICDALDKLYGTIAGAETWTFCEFK